MSAKVVFFFGNPALTRTTPVFLYMHFKVDGFCNLFTSNCFCCYFIIDKLLLFEIPRFWWA